MSNIFDLFKQISADTPSKNAPISAIIVGLGNPGSEYRNTRHNTGFLMMDYLSQTLGVKVDKIKFKALVGEANFAGRRVLLMKPQTYMNLSGEAVREAAAFYKIAPENVLVFSDDISLAVGNMRVRRSGSDGGQKGLRSIILQLNSDAFPRIRFGIGEKPNPDYNLADWVLSNFTPAEQKILFDTFGRAVEGAKKILEGDIDGAMLLCNTKTERK